MYAHYKSKTNTLSPPSGVCSSCENTNHVSLNMRQWWVCRQERWPQDKCTVCALRISARTYYLRLPGHLCSALTKPQKMHHAQLPMCLVYVKAYGVARHIQL